MELLVSGPAGPQRVYAYSGGKDFDAALPVIVFLHGALNDHSVWTLLARWFANHGHAVLAPDLPGHSRSDGPAHESVESLGRWVHALLDAAGVGNAVLVGHSMGSLIALEAAAIAPERVRGLVMIGTAYPMAVSTALLATAAEAPLAAIDMVNAYSHSTLAAKPGYPAPGNWIHGLARALMRRVQAARPDRNLFLLDFEICNRYAGGLQAAAKVDCPVHFILGARDQMALVRQSAGLADALHADVTTLAAGHALMAEAPDGVLAALRRALHTAAPASTPAT